MTDPVNHPSHYTAGKYEVIDVIEDIIQFYTDAKAAGLVWQTIKYLARAPHKGAYEQDIKKAHFYLTRLVKSLPGYKSPDVVSREQYNAVYEENLRLRRELATLEDDRK